MATPQEKDGFFVPLSRFLKTKLKDEAQVDEVLDQLEQARSRTWSAKQYPHIASWLEKNEKPLVYVIEATKQPHYYSPLVSPAKENEPSGFTGAMNPGLQSYQNLAVALVARAMLRTAESRYEEAWQDLQACHRLSRLVARGGTIDRLVSVSMDSMAATADVSFLDQAKLTPKQTWKYLEALQKLPPPTPLADCVDGQERFFTLDLIMRWDRSPKSLQQAIDIIWSMKSAFRKPPAGEVNQRVQDFKQLLEDLKDVVDGKPVAAPASPKLDLKANTHDAALRNINSLHDRMATILRLADRAERQKQLLHLSEEFQKTEDRLFTKDWTKTAMDPVSFGEFLTATILPAAQSVQTAEERREQSQRNVVVAFALAAYRADTGKYPNKLEDLAPKYLAKIPADLFSGKPLIYRPYANGYLLYSVGVNGVDDEGRTMEDNPRGDDLRVRMPLPPLPKQ